MAAYDRFDSLARHIAKNSGTKTGPEFLSDLHDAFVSCLPEIPENLKHDICYYFESLVTGSDGVHAGPLLVAKLNEVLHLFEGEYDRVHETFTSSDWDYLKNVIDDFALDIDQQRLTYIMRQITSRGIMDT